MKPLILILILVIIMVSVRDCLLHLEEKGWSALIDTRWKQLVIEELTNGFPGITDDIIEEVLKIIIV
jgi:hypothetical protein